MDSTTVTEVAKVSEITEQHIANYIRLIEPTEQEKSDLKTYLTVAKQYIKNNTGVTDLDLYSDFIIVVYILCQDMYDNRTMYIEKGNVNQVVDTILGLHSVNLL